MNLVLLIVDLQFGDKPVILPQACPLWIVESKSNRDMLKRSSASLGLITWFPRKEGESAAQVFARIAQALDQHHNELAQDPPYDTLDAYGLPADVDMLESVRDLGFLSQVRRSGVTRFLKRSAEESPERPS